MRREKYTVTKYLQPIRISIGVWIPAEDTLERGFEKCPASGSEPPVQAEVDDHVEGWVENQHQMVDVASND